jgi:hypothetical protein
VAAITLLLLRLEKFQRLDENFLDFFQCEAVIEPGPHWIANSWLTHGNQDGHRNQAPGAPVQTGTSPQISAKTWSTAYPVALDAISAAFFRGTDYGA